MSAYPVISLSSRDGVVIARATLEPGTPIAEGLTTSERIPPGHKVAIRPHMAGEAVSKFGQIIGFATQPIAPGQHVHVHNLGAQPRHGRFRQGLRLRRRRQTHRNG